MIRHLLDTDHVSLIEAGHPPLRSRLSAVDPFSLAVSIVTVQEVLEGRLAVVRSRVVSEARVRAYRKFGDSVRFFNAIQVLPFDDDCERQFTRLRGSTRIGSQDLKIATTALVNGLVVVTRNRKDFMSIPNLIVEDWSL